MKKFNVYGKVFGTKFLGVVEAKNKKDAENKGFDLESIYVSLCHQCSDQCEDAEVVSIDAEEVDE